MSAFRRQTSRQLHEEHLHVIGLLDRLAHAATRLGGTPPAPDDALWSQLLAQLAGALQHEVTRHFDLEEQRLFPLLREQGHGDLADPLGGPLDEHRDHALAVLAEDLAAVKFASCRAARLGSEPGRRFPARRPGNGTNGS